MEMTQFADFANKATQEILGVTDLQRENLTPMFSFTPKKSATKYTANDISYNKDSTYDNGTVGKALNELYNDVDTLNEMYEVITVEGSTPVINAAPNRRYKCGEVSTININVPTTGIIDIMFTSGSTPTILTVTPPSDMTMKWANGFDPTTLDANTIYEINIMDGCYGVVGTWT